MNGKQKRVKRPQMIDGMPEDEFIFKNADPIGLLQERMYEELYQWEQERDAGNGDEFSKEINGNSKPYVYEKCFSDLVRKPGADVFR